MLCTDVWVAHTNTYTQATGTGMQRESNEHSQLDLFVLSWNIVFFYELHADFGSDQWSFIDVAESLAIGFRIHIGSSLQINAVDRYLSGFFFCCPSLPPSIFHFSASWHLSCHSAMTSSALCAHTTKRGELKFCYPMPLLVLINYYFFNLI